MLVGQEIKISLYYEEERSLSYSFLFYILFIQPLPLNLSAFSTTFYPFHVTIRTNIR